MESDPVFEVRRTELAGKGFKMHRLGPDGRKRVEVMGG
jgi:hypothetical protein